MKTEETILCELRILDSVYQLCRDSKGIYSICYKTSQYRYKLPLSKDYDNDYDLSYSEFCKRIRPRLECRESLKS